VEKMNEDEKLELIKKKQEEVMVAQQIGMSVMMAINLIFSRWREKGWDAVANKKMMLKITIEEVREPKKKPSDNNNKRLYV
jgi:hypothetical protein